MNIHYLKVALRNLWKYRTQSIISILGLAAGFVCFALSALWTRYELSYDNFHDGADRIYYVHGKEFDQGNVWNFTPTPCPLAAYLEKSYPEVETACSLNSRSGEIEKEGYKSKAKWLEIDSAFFTFFRVKVLSGSLEFAQAASGKVALTDNYAQTLFPNEEALGKIINVWDEEYKVGAIVSGWSGHSFIPYDLLLPFSVSSIEKGWKENREVTFVKLNSNTDNDAFIERLQKTTIHPDKDYETQLSLTLLTKKQYERPESWRINYMHLMELRLFLYAGALLIISALLNYWGVFSSLLRIRHREVALRLVNGSSWWKVWKLFCTDVLLLLAIAMAIGLVGIELFMTKFIELTQIESSRLDIYLETLLYVGIVILTALIFLSFSVCYLRRNSLYHTLSQKTSKRHGKDYFRKGCLLMQLVISLGFIFCTSVMLKQMYHLKHTDIGLKRENRATLLIVERYAAPLIQKIKQLPQTVRVVDKGSAIFPNTDYSGWITLDEWEGKPEDAKTPIEIRCFEMSREMFDFYGIHVIEGEMPDIVPDDQSILINETLARQLQVKQPVGIALFKSGMVIRGIVPDFHIQSPTLPTQAMIFKMPRTSGYKGHIEVMLEYQGKWDECRKSIENIRQTMYPEEDNVIMGFNSDDAFEYYLKSERNLMNLLSIVSAVCILISIFGVYSLTALQCEQRRKEIAIRKVNGATTSDILHMFFREYLWILLIAAVIAFPIGTILMKQWLEQYTLQTALSPWVYLSILVVVAAALYGSMVWRVGRAARQNPAEVIKMNQ